MNLRTASLYVKILQQDLSIFNNFWNSVNIDCVENIYYKLGSQDTCWKSARLMIEKL